MSISAEKRFTVPKVDSQLMRIEIFEIITQIFIQKERRDTFQNHSECSSVNDDHSFLGKSETSRERCGYQVEQKRTILLAWSSKKSAFESMTLISLIVLVYRSAFAFAFAFASHLIYCFLRKGTRHLCCISHAFAHSRDHPFIFIARLCIQSLCYSFRCVPRLFSFVLQINWSPSISKNVGLHQSYLHKSRNGCDKWFSVCVYFAVSNSRINVPRRTPWSRSTSWSIRTEWSVWMLSKLILFCHDFEKGQCVSG